jgi:hypothetical protein
MTKEIQLFLILFIMFASGMIAKTTKDTNTGGEMFSILFAAFAVVWAIEILICSN